MFSLTIHFGPSNMVWAFMFKEKETANAAMVPKIAPPPLDEICLRDDFGQVAFIKRSAIHGMVLEDLDQVEAARIQRSLAEERCKVKLMTAAKNDPVIGQAMRGQTPVLTPQGRF